MSLLYSLTASLLGALEVADAVMIWSRGRLLGQYEFDPRRFSSYAAATTTPAIQADLQFLADWIGFTKLLVAVGLITSAWSNEPKVRFVAATSYGTVMGLAFARMIPSMRLAAELDEVPKDAPVLFGRVTKIVMGLLGVSALLEYRAVMARR